MNYLIKEGIDTKIIKRFDYISADKLKNHEKFIPERTNSLKNYIQACVGIRTIPSVIVCHDTLVVIDGHHRLQVMNELGFQFIPCLLIDYHDSNIIVHPLSSEITKDTVIKAGLTENYLPPKSTQHMVLSSSGKLYPIIILSPIVYIENQVKTT